MENLTEIQEFNEETLNADSNTVREEMDTVTEDGVEEAWVGEPPAKIAEIDVSQPKCANQEIVAGWLSRYYYDCTKVDPGLISGLDVGAKNITTFTVGRVVGAISGVLIGFIGGKIWRTAIGAV